MEPLHIQWIQKSNGEHDEYAVLAGIDSGKKMYVARAHYRGGVIPGKLHIGHSSAYVPYGGQEISKPHYEVLTAPPGTLSWVDCEGSSIPNNAIVGGRDPSGEPYYIGRAVHLGTVTVGKVQRSYGTCFISHGMTRLYHEVEKNMNIEIMRFSYVTHTEGSVFD